MEFFKTQKLKSSLEACFLLRAVLNLLWRRYICFYKLFLINESKNTEYLNHAYTNFIRFMKIRHNRQKTQKSVKDKKLVFQKNQ